MTPAGTSNELDVQNEWEENTHTHCMYSMYSIDTVVHGDMGLSCFFQQCACLYKYTDVLYSLTSQGRAEPLCARIESANREVPEGKADL